MSVPTYQFYDTDVLGKHVHLGVMPVYKTAGAACADIALPRGYEVQPKSGAKLGLKIGFEIPEGYKIVMYPRSSTLMEYGIISPVSIIDWDYKMAEVSFPCFNLTDKPVVLMEGTRVAQIELVPMGIEVEEWKRENNIRSLNGFGGTGK